MFSPICTGGLELVGETRRAGEVIEYDGLFKPFEPLIVELMQSLGVVERQALVEVAHQDDVVADRSVDFGNGFQVVLDALSAEPDFLAL
jgi:hypothetical protein